MSKDLPHQILRKPGRETLCLFFLDPSQWYIIEFKGQRFSQSPGKHLILGLGGSKLKAAYSVDYFPESLAKMLRIAHQVIYSSLSPWSKMTKK